MTIRIGALRGGRPGSRRDRLARGGHRGNRTFAKFALDPVNTYLLTAPHSPIPPKRTSTRAHTASHPPQHPPDGLLGRHLHPRRHGAAVARDRSRRHIQGWWHRAVQPVRARRLGDGARVHRRHRPPPRLRPRRRLPARARRVGRGGFADPGRRGGVRAPVRAGARLGRRALRGRLRQPPHPADHAGGRGDERGGQRRRRPPRRPRVARLLLQPVRHRHRRCRPPPNPQPARSHHSPPRPLLLLRRAQRMYVADYSNNCVRVVARRRRRNLVEGRRDAARLAVRHRRHAARPEDGRRHLRLLLPPLPRRHHSGEVSILAGCGAARHADGAGSEAAFHAPNGARAILAQLGALLAQLPPPCRSFCAPPLARSAPPSGLAVDADDVLYVADSGNHCIRRGAEGVVSTVAGTGDAGIDGSRLNSPCGVCLLPAGARPRPPRRRPAELVREDGGRRRAAAGARRAVDAPRRPPPPPRPRSRGRRRPDQGGGRGGLRGAGPPPPRVEGGALRPLRALPRDVHLGDARVLRCVRPNPRRRLYRLPRAPRLPAHRRAGGGSSPSPSSSS